MPVSPFVAAPSTRSVVFKRHSYRFSILSSIALFVFEDSLDWPGRHSAAGSNSLGRLLLAGVCASRLAGSSYSIFCASGRGVILH